MVAMCGVVRFGIYHVDSYDIHLFIHRNLTRVFNGLLIRRNSSQYRLWSFSVVELVILFFFVCSCGHV